MINQHSEKHPRELWTSCMERLLEQEGIPVSPYYSASVGSSLSQAQASSIAYIKGHPLPLELYLRKEIVRKKQETAGGESNGKYNRELETQLQKSILQESISLHQNYGAVIVTFDLEETTASCRELLGPLGPGPTEAFAKYRVNREYPVQQVIREFLEIMIKK